MALYRVLLSSRLSSALLPSLSSPLPCSSFSTSPVQAARGGRKKKEEGERKGSGFRKLFYILPAFSFSLGVWQVRKKKREKEKKKEKRKEKKKREKEKKKRGILTFFFFSTGAQI